jgi:parvulin-like peptidyl-prolyl isomerase
MPDFDALLVRAAAGALRADEQRALAATLAARRARRRRCWRVGLALGAALGAGVLTAGPTVPAGDAPFAQVNDTTVPYASFYAALADNAGAEVATRVVLEALMRQEAGKRGLLPTDAEVDTRFGELLAERFGGSRDTLAKWMAENAADDDTVRHMVYAELLDIKLRTNGLQPTADELKAWFKANQAKRYDEPETFEWREIVLTSKEKAAQVAAELNAGKTDFVSAVAKYSANTESAADGGRLGPVPTAELEAKAAALLAALRKLGPGETTRAPVEFDGRWYLLRLVKRTPGEAAVYDTLVARVRRDYLVEKAAPDAEFYAKLAKTARVSGMAARFRAVEGQFGPEGSLQPPKPGGGG